MGSEKAYRELIESSLFQNGPVVLFLWENTPGWPVQAVSSNVKQLYGYDPTAYTSGELAYADQIHLEDIQRVFSEVQEASIGHKENFIHKPYRYKSYDGIYHWIQDSTLILRDKDGEITHYVGYINDISELISTHETLCELNHDLIQSQKEVEVASQAKDSFLANASHEIRTPMNAILGFVDILSKGEDDEARQKQFNHIRNAGQSLLSIINDTLDFSKIESDKLTIENHSFMTKELFENASFIYQESAQAKDIDFEYHIGELPGFVVGDDVRIKQVVFNLLSNAIKFTPKKGKVILEVSFDRESEVLFCSVKDTGKGIHPDSIDKIFKPFEQEDDSTTREFGGTGLGLAISSSLVERMEGKLLVESALGEGSCFSFSLPLKIDDDGQREDREALDELPSLFSGHVLMVEDNKTNQALLKIYLLEMGLSFDIANDGLEAVTFFKNGHYDLILMDENMPNMNGIEATGKIQALEKEKNLKPTPIVAVTANSLYGDKERFLDAGMTDYVSKPFNDSDLKRIFEIYL